MKLGVRSRFGQFFSTQLLILYRGLICLCMECASHVRGGGVPIIQVYFSRKDGMKSYSSNHSLCYDCLSSAYFSSSQCCISCYLIPFFFFTSCSSDLANCIAPLLLQPRCTTLASFSHPHPARFSNAVVNRYTQSFIPFFGELCKSLL